MAWTPPGQPTAILEGGALHSLAIPEADQDDDGLPDAWEATVGLDPERRDHPHRDPDGDMLSTLGEHQHGTHPRQALDHKVHPIHPVHPVHKVHPRPPRGVAALNQGTGVPARIR